MPSDAAELRNESIVVGDCCRTFTTIDFNSAIIHFNHPYVFLVTDQNLNEISNNNKIKNKFSYKNARLHKKNLLIIFPKSARTAFCVFHK